MKACKSFPVVDFLTNSCTFPNAGKKELIKTSYTFKYYCSNQIWSTYKGFGSSIIGLLSPSRWNMHDDNYITLDLYLLLLTAVNRVLKLHVSEESASDELEYIITFVNVVIGLFIELPNQLRVDQIYLIII